MSDCCNTSSSKENVPKRHICPVNGKEYSSVSTTTILHHISQPWKWIPNSKNYYFCSDPECEVAYFGLDNSIINKSELRATVGIKEKSENSLICYCFDVTKAEARNSTIQNFVMEQTRKKICSCGTSNPSGQCCLKDFPKSL
jgi:hypothetical protein